MVLVAKQKRPTGIRHQKRYGQHHKQNKPYLKPYWPYLPILVVIILGVFVNAVWMRPSHGVLGYATDISETNLLNDTNADRQSNSEQALNLNDKLTAAAQTKANDMARENFWSHDTPSGEVPWTFIKQAGYNYESAGENLAYGFDSSSATLSAWMHSPDHRANILNKNYQDVGFGIANASNYMGHGPETIVVAMYAQPEGGATTTSPTSAISPTFTVVGSSSSAPIASINSKPVSRLQTFTDSPTWLTVLLAFVAGAGLVLLVIRHAKAWHNVLAKSEAFVIHHPFFDILLTALIVSSIVVNQTVGTIL